MKFEIWAVEFTREEYLREGEKEYLKRLKYYAPVEVRQFKGLKSKSSLTEAQVREKEYALIKPALDGEQAFLVLLDAGGKQYTSEAFAHLIEQWQLAAVKKVIFCIGGAYGFSDSLYERADMKLSLSDMTFTHQMVRLIFLEQLYRAMTIIRNEKYHH